MHNPVFCPACMHNKTLDIGSLKAISGVFVLDEPGHLHSCPCCGLFFRRPYPDSKTLEQLYSGLDQNIWQEECRPDQDIIRDCLLSKKTSGKILDIGCFRGDFLASFPPEFKKYGLEPSMQAQQSARKKGVTLLGESLETVQSEELGFDAVFMVDVIEHLPKPAHALKKAASMLAPGGLLLITTGNTNALPWRLLRNEYWYLFPEHVSFFNPQWFKWAAKKNGLSVERIKKFSHFKGHAHEKWKQFFKAALYSAWQNVPFGTFSRRILMRSFPFSKVALWKQAPATLLWPDHIFICLKKTAQEHELPYG